MDDGECLEIDSRLVHLMQYVSTVRIEPFELLNLTGLGFKVFATDLYVPYKFDVRFLSEVAGKICECVSNESDTRFLPDHRREEISAKCMCRRKRGA